MINELIDNTIGLFSPSWQRHRAQNRLAVEAIKRAGGYESGKQSRLHDRANPANRSADSWILSHGKLTRARARDLFMNNAYARGVVKAIVRNVVGTGIVPQARTDDEGFNRAAEELFKRMSPHCDTTGEIDFYEKQAAVLTDQLVAGETLEHFTEINDDPLRPLPLVLESIDIDRLADDEYQMRRLAKLTSGGDEIRMGILFDRIGRKKTFYIKKRHPEGINPFNLEIDEVPASEILHVYHKERPGQSRGMSVFAPVLWWLKNLGLLVESEVVARNVAACIGVAISTIDGTQAPGFSVAATDDMSDDYGNRFEHMEPGAVARLLPGEDIKVINPNRASQEGEVFINMMLRSVAVGTGISFERLSRDFSRTNFSSNRASDLEDRREFRQMQKRLVNQLCNPFWNRMIRYGVQMGYPGFPTALEFIEQPARFLACEWVPPGWEWVDPKNESQAQEVALKNNVTVLEDVWLSQGKDPQEMWEKLKKQKDQMEELGLTLSEQPEQQAEEEPEMEEANA